MQDPGKYLGERQRDHGAMQATPRQQPFLLSSGGHGRDPPEQYTQHLLLIGFIAVSTPLATVDVLAGGMVSAAKWQQTGQVTTLH
jgi:hypothetical protein